MGGCSMADEFEFKSPLTLVLVGRTGNGKSATGNSILRAKKFESKRSSSGVTITSQLKTTVLDDGRVLNVIDTPGLFDSSLDHEFIGKEIVSCIDMARNGIHAVLVVFSVSNRFSEEEKAVISSLITLFGSKILDYIIVVFTGGDELEDEDKTLDDFLSDSSESLKQILSRCGDRYLAFNNKTKDEIKRLDQLHKLLYLVHMVHLKNKGAPYSNELFSEFKKHDREGDQDALIRDEQFKHILEMVEMRLKETNLKLEELLAEERAARIEAEKKAETIHKKSEDELQKMKKDIEAAKKREMEEEQKRKKKEKQQKEEKRKRDEHYRQREEEARRQQAGCLIL